MATVFRKWLETLFKLRSFDSCRGYFKAPTESAVVFTDSPRSRSVTITDCEWLGKERDCVNFFASKFILPSVSESSAVTEYSQLRIECGVPQPVGFDRPSAAKDLVIWRGAHDVAWDPEWKATGIPWVVIEWKTRRSGRFNSMFDDHDVDWLKAFSAQNPESLGYAVTVDFRQQSRHQSDNATSCA